MDSERRALIKKYYNSLRLEEALNYANPIEREQYVTGLHQGQDAVELLFDAIGMQDGQGVFLFSGQKGSGKSTELKRLKYKLEQADKNCRVYYLDMREWMPLGREMKIHSFMVLLMAAWCAEVPQEAITRSTLEKIKGLLKSISVDKIDLEFNVAGQKLSTNVLLAKDAHVLSQIEQAGEQKRTEFTRQIHNFVDLMLEQLCPQRQKCIFLIDSLELLGSGASSAEKSREIYASIRETFSEHGETLKLPGVHVVYSIAPFVLEQNSNLPAQLGGGVAVQLPSVHVFKKHSHEVDSTGVDKVIQLLINRCPRLEEFIPRDYLEKMTEKSGGDLRDLMRGLRVALTAVVSKENPQENDIKLAMETAYQQIRPSMLLLREHMLWRAQVERTHHAELANDYGVDELTMERYLSTKHVLAYLNGETWYGLHPLIRDHVLAQAQSHEAMRSAQS